MKVIALGVRPFLLDSFNIFDTLSSTDFAPCHTGRDTSVKTGKISAVLHIEGAEMISDSLDELDLLFRRGVRSIGPLWSRSNIFGHGAPFSFPGSPDQGDGLTDAGKALIAVCDERRILVDLSHLNEAGFWDVAACSERPLMATHSNAHALCPAPRNLTDRQIDAIAERGGIVGACFASAYLRDDGRKQADTPLELILRQHGGVGHLVFGHLHNEPFPAEKVRHARQAAFTRLKRVETMRLERHDQGVGHLGRHVYRAGQAGNCGRRTAADRGEGAPSERRAHLGNGRQQWWQHCLYRICGALAR